MTVCRSRDETSDYTKCLLKTRVKNRRLKGAINIANDVDDLVVELWSIGSAEKVATRTWRRDADGLATLRIDY